MIEPTMWRFLELALLLPYHGNGRSTVTLQHDKLCEMWWKVMGHWDHCWKCTRYQWVDWYPVTFVAALNVCAIIVAAAVEDCRCILDSWKCDDSGTCEIWANFILINVNWRGATNHVTFVGTLNVCGVVAPYLKRSSESTRSLLFLLRVAIWHLCWMQDVQ
jgi:hypothetical protein